MFTDYNQDDHQYYQQLFNVEKLVWILCTFASIYVWNIPSCELIKNGQYWFKKEETNSDFPQYLPDNWNESNYLYFWMNEGENVEANVGE